MRKKIISLLFVLFLLFTFGALIAALHIEDTTNLFNNLIKLHQIEGLRHDLVEKVLKVQSDLYTVNTPLSRGLEDIVITVEGLDKSAKKCISCHHEPAISQKLEKSILLIDDLQEALSYYITASANRQRIDKLKTDAALIGNELLNHTEIMAFDAAKNIDKSTKHALGKVKKTKIALSILFIVTFFFGVLVALNLTTSITRPTHQLVLASRKIAAGELGYTISEEYKAEFGELASNFNLMSVSLKNGYTKLQQEITERRQTEEALSKSEERYALAALGANDGLWDWDLKSNVIYFSPRWKTMLGYDEKEIGSSPAEWLNMVHTDDRMLLEAKLNAHIDGHTSHFENEHRMRHREGTYRWMRNRGIALRDSSGVAYRMAGSQTDITEHKKTEEQLVHDAFHDTLTDLPNRALLMNRLQHVIDAAQRRNDYLFAVLFIDLDRFKYINDSLGHVVGDQLLIAVGKRLSGFVRPSDTVARLGGDEFAILLEDIKDRSDAIKIAQRIEKDLPLPFDICGHDVSTTASVGIVMHSEGDARPEHLLRDADLAMYQAKANGKARYEIFDAAMHARLMKYLMLETDLRHAIERNEFRLHYQPILSLATNRITGFEALIRWQHPFHGLIYPTEFISIAEETGLITSIGQWVLREACRKTSLWQKQFFTTPPLTINVNLSCKEFTPLLIENIEQILHEIDIDASTLMLEITESTIMKNPESTAPLLLELKNLGVGLQIDDFGTGYSSLSYLHNLPVSVLKIDQSFIRMVNADRENLEIVKTIVALAHNLDMDVIAEGVETADELETLRELGCEYVQGHLISRPIESETAEDLIAADTHRINYSLRQI
ncbi:MAG: PAS/PAC sensor-containing diguanylate [Geobacteraceae bacterium]|nr:MAG: PAS/PAC sensor-containing diguanylate [Geobacteraceae bacterium]